ncbi:hypothetical protein L5515_017479 [Caenorhabditis briggsae]|uniref:Uncharacterized protein n=1 Tax=Caenorhabditis briggsae TaxID=6238 RepID=A0AAE9FJK0_CAEBR|nr:hypothetical protein L5515_017479 [Caenorhabditis briggsae]
MSGKENRIQCASGAKKPVEPTEKDPIKDGFLKMPVVEKKEIKMKPMTAAKLKRGIGFINEDRKDEVDRDILTVSTNRYPHQNYENVEVLNTYRGLDRFGPFTGQRFERSY